MNQTLTTIVRRHITPEGSEAATELLRAVSAWETTSQIPRTECDRCEEENCRNCCCREIATSWEIHEVDDNLVSWEFSGKAGNSAWVRPTPENHLAVGFRTMFGGGRDIEISPDGYRVQAVHVRTVLSDGAEIGPTEGGFYTWQDSVNV